MPHGAACLIVMLLFGCAASSARASASISGRLSDPSYRLIVLLGDGRARVLRPKADGRFDVRLASAKGASLHLLREGRYAGPVVLRGKRPRILLAAARTARLGTVRVRPGVATTSRTVRGIGEVHAGARGRPIGAGRLGLVRAAARAGQANRIDPDADGIPSAFDVDDDGDLIIDSVDGTRTRGRSLSAAWTLALETSEAVNSNAGIDPDRDATIARHLRLTLVASPLRAAQRAGVRCSLAWCGEAALVVPPGLGESTTDWPDGDGDGLLDLAASGSRFGQHLYPRALPAQLSPADVLIAQSDLEDSAATSLGPHVIGSVAIKSIGPHRLAYPAGALAPGSPASLLTIPAQVPITIWRPQRRAIFGAELGTAVDMGGLRYGVDVAGGLCHAKDFSELSATLVRSGNAKAPLLDTARDAPPSGATLSFVVDAAACLKRGNAHGLNPRLTVFAIDAAGGLASQRLVVRSTFRGS